MAMINEQTEHLIRDRLAHGDKILEHWHDRARNIFYYIIRRQLEVPKDMKKRLKQMGMSFIYDFMCGYALFERCPLVMEGQDGLAGIVTVFGGITFSERLYPTRIGGPYVYGFDTAHPRSRTMKKIDQKFVHQQCESMGLQLWSLGPYSRNYADRVGMLKQRHKSAEGDPVLEEIRESALKNVLGVLEPKKGKR